MKVISGKCLPVKLPASHTAIAWLLMDRFSPPGWVWGSVGALFLLYWIVAIIAMCKQEPVEITLEANARRQAMKDTARHE